MSTVTPGAPTASGQEAAGWTAYLAGVPLGLELPEDRPHATERTYHEGRCPLAPSPSLLGGIAALAHKERTAPAMVWLAALQALLHRYTSETDVLVGSPAAGAEPAETAAPAVVAWRTRLDGDLSSACCSAGWRRSGGPSSNWACSPSRRAASSCTARPCRRTSPSSRWASSPPRRPVPPS